MRHVSDGTLRRLLDEPLSVPDAARLHLENCGRCRAGRGRVAEDAALASRLFTEPRQPAGGTDLAWAQLQRRMTKPELVRRSELKVPRYRVRRVAGVPAYAGAALGVSLVAGGVAAAATLTTVFAPATVAPLRVNAGDLRDVAAVVGLGTGSQMGGLPSGSGSRHLPFGTLTWAVSSPRKVASVSEARALTHLMVRAPATLPAGVGRLSGIYVEPAAKATFRFSAREVRPLGGTSLALTSGPAMLMQYGGDLPGTSLTTLGILTARAPVATSTGADSRQLENFLLSWPGMPSGVAREIRQLGNPGKVLPVPVPSGASVQHVRIGGAPAVLISAGSGTATAVIWESHGIIHTVAGLLNSKDILSVAHQAG